MDVEEINLDGITKDCKSVRIISPAYAGDEGELTAILQYSFQAILLNQQGLKEQAKIVEEISINEMEHLEILGSIICKLGVVPVYSYLPPYPINFYSTRYVNYATSPQKMFAADIEAEECAIELYTKIICKLKDPVVIAAIEKIRKDEIRHLAAFKELLANTK